MANISLWKASDEYYQLCEQLYNTADEDGVVDAKVFENTIAARETFESKAVACGMVIRQWDKDIYGIEEELERLKRIKESLLAKKRRLADSLSAACIKTGVESIKGLYASISFRASEETIIDDESQIPREYLTEKPRINPTRQR